MTIGNGWGLPAGVGLMAIMTACGGAPSGDDAVGVGESSLSGSGSSSTSSSGIPLAGNGTSNFGALYGSLSDCQKHLDSWDDQLWQAGACGYTDYVAYEQSGDVECVGVGSWGYAKVLRKKISKRATDAHTNQGTPGCNDASNCPFFCLETAFVSSDFESTYCNTWDGTTLHMDLAFTTSYTSAPSLTYLNVHWGSGNGIYTKTIETPANDAWTAYNTPCSTAGSYNVPTFEAAATRTHTP
ncbi:MAG TPA: hypothetical protein VIF62_02080 [Labilithrix sp.]